MSEQELDKAARLAYEAFSGDIFVGGVFFNSLTPGAAPSRMNTSKDSGPPPSQREPVKFEKLTDSAKATWRKVAVAVLNYDRTNYHVTIKKEEKST